VPTAGDGAHHPARVIGEAAVLAGTFLHQRPCRIAKRLGTGIAVFTLGWSPPIAVW
jgi:hypothetical protein